MFAHPFSSRLVGVVLLLLGFMPLSSVCQEKQNASQDAAPSAPSAKPLSAKEAAARELALEQQDLQKAIELAGNDRAAMVRNLQEFLKKYPESSQRPQIYRALVESSLQLRDFATATEYSERMVALTP